ncbi:C-C motif chemokine 4 homolog [Astyanax mexicanus]|uniref:C-C motif chemokine 4 homolog n=1 Tax=Astyanax mexicanus TaxID=7994 RepID=UPI000BBE009A|nr:C-C motif chemokine 4 homolog [Astyanax mexicanus]
MSAEKMRWMGLTLGLVLLIAVSSDAAPLAIQQPEECCFTFVSFTIPKHAVEEIKRLSVHCPKPGYIVTTPKGRMCQKTLDISKD